MKESTYKFQLILDTDSIFISQSPKTNKSRLLLANLGEAELLQIAQSIIYAGIGDKFLEILNSEEFDKA